MRPAFFVKDYDLKVGRGPSYSVYHFKAGDSCTLVREDERGPWIFVTHLGEFQVPYHVLGLSPPPPKPKTRFDIIEEF